MNQIRVMIDTSVYEFLHLQHLSALNNLVEGGKVVVYGCRVVRQELREISPKMKFQGKSFRNILLNIYGELTEKHDYPLDASSENLAEDYWVAYEGGISRRKLANDFRIVAIASLHGLDVVVSEDDKSMKSRQAIMAYLKANNAKAYRTPAFYSIKEIIP